MWPFSKKPAAAAGQLLLTQPATNPAQVSSPVAAASLAPAVPPKPSVPMERPASTVVDVRTENIKSVIAEGELCEGNLRFQRGLKVDGHIKGNVEFGITDGMLVVTDKGRIEGNLYGPRAILCGEIVGDIMIAGRLIVLPSARIHGDIAAGTLQLHEGASVDGRICTISDFRQKTIEHQADGAEASAAPAAVGGVYPFQVAANG